MIKLSDIKTDTINSDDVMRLRGPTLNCAEHEVSHTIVSARLPQELSRVDHFVSDILIRDSRVDELDHAKLLAKRELLHRIYGDLGDDLRGLLDDLMLLRRLLGVSDYRADYAEESVRKRIAAMFRKLEGEE